MLHRPAVELNSRALSLSYSCQSFLSAFFQEDCAPASSLQPPSQCQVICAFKNIHRCAKENLLILLPLQRPSLVYLVVAHREGWQVDADLFRLGPRGPIPLISSHIVYKAKQLSGPISSPLVLCCHAEHSCGCLLS